MQSQLIHGVGLSKFERTTSALQIESMVYVVIYTINLDTTYYSYIFIKKFKPI